MKHPIHWTKSDLHLHLQHALDLELWTVPLYLTALYSIKGLKGLKPHDYPEAAKLLYSVAVQEMLHVEIVCNLANAFGWSLQFRPPQYGESKGVPFIHPAKEYLPEMLHGYSSVPQALSEKSLRLFCAIELPHPKKEFAFEQERAYDSIADMYEALRIGITAMWDQCYIGDEHNRKQKNSFREYDLIDRRRHGFSQPITTREEALKAIDAVVEQGEGANSLRVPVDYRPPERAEDPAHDAGWFKGHLSHYQKFRFLLHHHHKLPPVYEVTHNGQSSASQLAMKAAFAEVLKELESTFSAEGDEMSIDFWTKMYAFAYSIIDVWESGACPQFD